MTISNPLIEKINVLFQKAEVLRQRDTRAKAQRILDRMEADNITIGDLREVAETLRPKQDTRKSEPVEAGHPAHIDGETVQAAADIPRRDKHSPPVGHVAQYAKEAEDAGCGGR